MKIHQEFQSKEGWFKEIHCALAPSSLVKQVFKELEFLGWYTTGGPPDPSDIHVHKQVCIAHTCACRVRKWRMRGGKMGIPTLVYCLPLPGV